MFIAVAFVIFAAFKAPPVLNVTLYVSTSEIVAPMVVASVMLIVSVPAPPEIVSPEDKLVDITMVSFAAPPSMLSLPAPGVRISAPALP